MGLRRMLMALLLILTMWGCAKSEGPINSHNNETQEPAALQNDDVQDNASKDFPAGSEPVPQEGILLLNEVVFFPREGQYPFIELINAGGTQLNLKSAAITNHSGQILELSAEDTALAPGELLLITFNGEDGRQPGIIYSSLVDFLDPAAGELTLLDEQGEILDRVAWGSENGLAVKIGTGGVPDEPSPGISIGRVPNSIEASNLAWVSYLPAETTPGIVNKYPGAVGLLPFWGTVFSPSDVWLSWYPVPGISEYRLQIANDIGLSDVIIEEVLTAPPFETDGLDPGKYYWQVQAIFESGDSADFSPPNAFTVKAETADTISHKIAAPSGQGETKVLLPVPLIEQKKDTNMLLLELSDQSANHGWNVPHPGLDTSDPADNTNCTLASISMVNHYYGGNLSQDRIGYEIFSDRDNGPEQDLNFGRGFFPAELLRALGFALGGIEPQANYGLSGEDLFTIVKTEIDEGRPIIAVYSWGSGGSGAHAVVIVGYDTPSEGKYIIYNDPAGKQITLDISDTPGNPADAAWSYLALIPAGVAVNATDDDPEIHQDSDSDRVNDFDEIYRFKTNPNSKDSDGDSIEDFIEIWASVFEPGFGYALNKPNEDGRDFDHDGTARELDPDSDDGGCRDDFEDFNSDGIFNGGSGEETDNYNDHDDRCISLEMVFLSETETGILEILWEGSFIVNEDSELEGTGQGSVDGQSDWICIDPYTPNGVRNIDLFVKGTFNFTIAGNLMSPAGEKETYLLDINGSESWLKTTWDDPECVGPDPDEPSFVSVILEIIGFEPDLFTLDQEIVIDLESDMITVPTMASNGANYEIYVYKIEPAN